MRGRVLAVVVAAVAGFVLLSGFRGGFGGGCGGGHPGRMTRMINAHVDDVLDDLKATDTQRKQVHGLVDGLVKEGEGLKAGHEQARADVLTQWNAVTPDANKLHGLVDSRLEVFKGFAHKVVDAGLQLHDILTPEQRAQVSERVESHHR